MKSGLILTAYLVFIGFGAVTLGAAENMALSFEGDDRVVIADTPGLNPSQITVECWVNFGRLAYGDGYAATDSQTFVCKGGDRSPGAYYFSQSGYGPGAYRLAFSCGQFWTGQYAGSDVPLETFHWYHVAGTYDGDTIRLYVDGVLAGSKQIGNIALGNAKPLYLSYNDVSGFTYFLTGKMDGVRIWNCARTQEQIQSMMNIAVVGNEPGLVGYWDFNELAGSQTIVDRTSSGSTGQLGSTLGVDTDDPIRVSSDVDWPLGGTVASPAFSPAGGIYYAPQIVTMTCATAGAVIHYTTDGSEPTCGSETYTSGVQVNASKTVRAIACKDGMNPSDVVSVDYTIREPIVVYVSTTGSDLTGDGTSLHPWQTIQYAVDQIDDINATVNVMPGTYNEQVVVQSIADGLHLVGSGADVTTIDASGVPYNGGVIKLYKGTGYVISGFTITGGTYEGSGTPGGAIRGMDGGPGWDESTVSARVENNVIKDNYSYGYRYTGGGISLGPDCEILNNKFINNSARYGSGAVYVGARSLIEDNTFEGNSSDSFRGGGAIESQNASVVISRNVFLNNSAGYRGGAFSGSATLSNNLFVGNDAGGDGGGAAYLVCDFWSGCSGSGGSFVNNTLVGNIVGSSGSGSGLYVAGRATVKNNVIVNGVDGVGIYVPGGIAVSQDNNNIWGNDLGSYGGSAAPGRNDIHADPKFVNLAAGDYHLQLISPCINSGENGVLALGSVDMDGATRVFPTGGTVDTGAYEYNAQTVWSPGEAKNLCADGTELYLTAHGPMVTTATFNEMPAYYVEQSNGVSGIQCRGLGLLNPGQCGVLHGTMGTIVGERVLMDASVVDGSLSLAPIPSSLAMNNRNLGGGQFGFQPGVWGAEGLNNIGLLVRMTGRIVERDLASPATWFKMDDGSGMNVKCLVPSGVTVDQGWVSVVVTGISSCAKVGDDLHRLLRVREQGDIAPY